MHTLLLFYFLILVVAYFLELKTTFMKWLKKFDFHPNKYIYLLHINLNYVDVWIWSNIVHIIVFSLLFVNVSVKILHRKAIFFLMKKTRHLVRWLFWVIYHKGTRTLITPVQSSVLQYFKIRSCKMLMIPSTHTVPLYAAFTCFTAQWLG